MVFPITILPAGGGPVAAFAADGSSRTGSLTHPIEEMEVQLRRTNEQLQFLSQQLQDAPNHLEEMLEQSRHSLQATIHSIDETRRENEALHLEVDAKSLRLKELEVITSSGSRELADNFDPRAVQTRAIAAESELSSLRKDSRALALQKTELQLTRESLEKTLARREAEGLDDTTAGVKQMQTLQVMIHDEELRSETIRRQVLHSEDCSSMLVTMQSKAVHLTEMVDNYKTQTERLFQQYEQLVVDCAEDDQRAREELQQAQSEVDAAAVSCRRLETELRTQVQSMQGALVSQKEKAHREKAMLKELLHMTQEEVTDLMADIEALMKERREIEQDNLRLSHSIEHHPVMTAARHFLAEDQHMLARLTQHRSAPSHLSKHVSFATRNSNVARIHGTHDNDEGDGFVIHTGPPLRASTTSLTSSTGLLDREDVADGNVSLAHDWEKLYVTRLQVRIGILEREEHIAAKEKEMTAAQLDHFSQHMVEEQRAREKELHILRSEVRALSYHEQVRIAKTENAQLRAVVNERDHNSALEEEDVEIAVTSLESTIEELQSRIVELTNNSLEKERAQQQHLSQQHALVTAARHSFANAEDGAKRAAAMRERLQAAELENKRLRECFKVEWGRRDVDSPSAAAMESIKSSGTAMTYHSRHSPSPTAALILRGSPPRTRPRPLPLRDGGEDKAPPVHLRQQPPAEPVATGGGFEEATPA
ncbi:Hypothetical protein, putative [Bodo saltans]|uniref:Uncharacterized protein n=1 Tax=Bodo saltans TaxID=75058 RepID=A0A0S4JJJ7_BODSA|nr:Hypothetical protein, putative [Bodo saltans]|eukprot:CUG90321.1 Hypothetical protein, putative [Bodo saltans]